MDKRLSDEDLANAVHAAFAGLPGFESIMGGQFANAAGAYSSSYDELYAPDGDVLYAPLPPPLPGRLVRQLRAQRLSLPEVVDGTVKER